MFVKIGRQALRTKPVGAVQLIETNRSMTRHTERHIAVKFDLRFIIAHNFSFFIARRCRFSSFVFLLWQSLQIP